MAGLNTRRKMFCLLVLNAPAAPAISLKKKIFWMCGLNRVFPIWRFWVPALNCSLAREPLFRRRGSA